MNGLPLTIQATAQNKIERENLRKWRQFLTLTDVRDNPTQQLVNNFTIPEQIWD